MLSWSLVSVTVLTAGAKSMVPLWQASAMAWRKDPAPLSLPLATVPDWVHGTSATPRKPVLAAAVARVETRVVDGAAL